MSGSVISLRYLSGRDFESKGIDWWTNSLVSHVEFGTPEHTWIGAHLTGGIQERPYDYCTPSREFRYAIPCDESALDQLMKDCRSDIGTKYNTVDILGLALHNRHLNLPGSYECAQYVTIRTNGIGRPMLNLVPELDYQVTPFLSHSSLLLRGHLVDPKDYYVPTSAGEGS